MLTIDPEVLAGVRHMRCFDDNDGQILWQSWEYSAQFINVLKVADAMTFGGGRINSIFVVGYSETDC